MLSFWSVPDTIPEAEPIQAGSEPPSANLPLRSVLGRVDVGGTSCQLSSVWMAQSQLGLFEFLSENYGVATSPSVVPLCPNIKLLSVPQEPERFPLDSGHISMLLCRATPHSSETGRTWLSKVPGTAWSLLHPFQCHSAPICSPKFWPHQSPHQSDPDPELSGVCVSVSCLSAGLMSSPSPPGNSSSLVLYNFPLCPCLCSLLLQHL